MKSIRSRLIFIAALAVLSVYVLIPTYIYMSQPVELRNDQDHMKTKIPSWLPKGHLNLGLDLQGGVQLVLGVNLTQAVENRLARIGTDISHWNDNKDAVIRVKSAYVIKDQGTLRIELEDPSKLDALNDTLKKDFPTLERVKVDGSAANYEFKADQIQSIKTSALEQAERVVRSRVDKWGVTEPIINRRADGSILAQLPGFKDPAKAKELLGRTAQLKFKIVDDDFKGFETVAASVPADITVDRSSGSVAFISEDKAKITQLTAGLIPPDRELVFGKEVIAGGAKQLFRSYVVKAATEITGDDVLDAMVTVDNTGFENKPGVSLKFTALGGKRFEETTGANVRKRMAILLDDLVESAPVINQKIGGGSAVINMGGSRSYDEIVKEATELSMVLKSGALPATITILEQRQVGASLGPELAQKGVNGVLVGLAFVFAFMLIYYRRPGTIACIALMLNGLFLLATMSMFGFALTLPGIAGFVLSLGMAVDANVLINERIRQELREGRNARAALDNGFSKVFWTVIDSHVTALLASFILLGTNTSGPIKGFAVTLAIGLILSIFTSLYCSHVFFDWALKSQTDMKKVFAWLGGENAAKDRKFNFNFIKYDGIATVIAIGLSIAVLIAALTKGFNWSVDFVGGTEVEVAFNQSVQPEALRASAEKAGIHDISIQALKGSDKEYLIRFEEKHAEGEQKGNLTTAQQDAAHASGGARINRLQESIRSDLADKQPQFLKVDYVGPQVGKEMRNQGFISMFYAILGIMIYLGFRFDFRFGSGAVLKLIPDVCGMLAFYLIFWRSFDLTAVAALLTGIGYSVNDVIVVFDRIREHMNMPGGERKSFAELINTSINESLTRTINTSVVTNLSLVGIIIFGPESIRNFALSMTVGIIGATFSTNFVGSGYLLWVDKLLKKRSDRNVSKAATTGSY
ncbi:MAG: protein translocase subunit SecD [Proteobacteria bacterium]|nr:protein translocase subunit SecD [Pseudomonadota bacterium]